MSKGHREFAVRGCLALASCALTLALASNDVDPSHKPATALCQCWVALTLFGQWHTGRRCFFVLRGASGLARFLLLLQESVCGRTWYGLLWLRWLRFSPRGEGDGGCGSGGAGEACDIAGWADARMPFRVLHALMALRFLCIATSLLLQVLYPARGVTATCGNRQILRRSMFQTFGIPVSLARGVLKIALLRGTHYERSPLESVVDFLRAAVFLGNACSLLRQWRTSGLGFGGGQLDEERQRCEEGEEGPEATRGGTGVSGCREARKAEEAG